MTTHTDATDLEEFDKDWIDALEETPFARLILGLTGLTRLGERPASLKHLATVVGRPVVETAALVRGAMSARIEGDQVHWDDPFPGEKPRRTLHFGDRAVPMKSGCVPDLFVLAAVLDVPFRVEDTCAATGAPIRVDFTPRGYERVDPPEAVAVLLEPRSASRIGTSGLSEQADANVCAHQPFFASAQAAAPVLQARPGSRAFTVPEMFQRPFYTHYRDTLRPLIHPDTH